MSDGMVDTSMYDNDTNAAMDTGHLNSIVKAMEIKNMTDTANKIRGGMPNTQSALGMLGAGQPYPSSSPNLDSTANTDQ